MTDNPDWEDGYDDGEAMIDAHLAQQQRDKIDGPLESYRDPEGPEVEKGFQFNDGVWTHLACGQVAKRIGGLARTVYCECGGRTRL